MLFSKYLRAKKYIELYEKQQNTDAIDWYLKEFSTLDEAIGNMRLKCDSLQTKIYCYQKRNYKFVCLSHEIPNATAIHILSPYIS